ncbi:MAG: RNA pyrophosphohydrolase [Chthoniobacter sp.]|nr:RNA pyrophosphohydrolase [Chthoniobacter sp.]
MSENEITYKPNVAAILRNSRGRILVCERLGVPGAWQFPQGGIDDGETPEQALIREVWEEIGVQAEDIHILERKGPYRYLYGSGRIKRGHHGKEQFYFLCEYSGLDAQINVDTKHPEFQAFRWIATEDFQLAWLPEMKREVYRTVFADFFGTKI